MGRKVISLFLSLSIVFSILAFTALPASADDFTALFKLNLKNKEDGSPLKIGEKPSGLKSSTAIYEIDGQRYMKGPITFICKPTGGQIKVKFNMLGISSTSQKDMVVFGSNGGKPFATIRNVNSSARLNNKTVIPSTGNQYTEGSLYEVEVLIDTVNGTINVITDGTEKYNEALDVLDAKLISVSFPWNGISISDLSIEATELPSTGGDVSTLASQITIVKKQVSDLTEDTEQNVRKKAVLLYHIEQLDKAVEDSEFEKANSLISDIEYGVEADMSGEDLNQAWLMALEQEENNPYLNQTMADDWYKNTFSAADYKWELPTVTINSYSGINGKYGSRDQASSACKWMLLYSHPKSPLKGKTELLVRSLRRIDAFLESYKYFETMKTNGFLNDFFALGPAIMAANMIDKTYPGLLLPNQRKLWNEVIEFCGTKWRKGNYMKDSGNYSNCDLGNARILISAGIFLNNQELFDEGMWFAYSYEKNIYPDGASAYIAKQNESPGYHGWDIDEAFDIYIMTGDQRVKKILKKLEYYPITVIDPNHVTEWSTPPTWKQSWYGTPGPVSNIIYYLTGNQYYKALKTKDVFDITTEPNMRVAYVYKTYPYVEKKIPANYLVYDRNIEGPRMNYGLVSAVGNGRVTEQLLGKATYVGMTIADPRKDSALDAAIYTVNAFPVIPGKTSTSTMSKESISVATGHDFAALGADYGLAARFAGPTRRDIEWNGKQSWLYLPDRLIGYVEVSPNNSQNALNVAMAIEIGQAKAGAVKMNTLKKISDNEYAYGNLLITIHDTNFKGAKISLGPDGIVSDDYTRGPHTELYLIDENTDKFSENVKSYSEKYYAVMEIRAAWAPENAKVTKILTDDTVGVTAEVFGRQYTTIYNFGSSDVSVPTSQYTKSGKSSLFEDRTTFAPPVNAPANAVIPSKQSVIIVSGSDEGIHKQGIVGWHDFIDYYEKNMDEFDSIPVPYKSNDYNMPDIKSHWAKGPIIGLVIDKVISGFEDKTFRPNENANVDAVIKMLVSAKGKTVENGKEYWASTWIEESKNIGIVKDGEFESYERPITRQEFARMIVRYLDTEDFSAKAEIGSKLSDYNAISDKYKGFVEDAYSKGIIGGFEDATFKAEANATRAELAVMIYRAKNPDFRLSVKLFPTTNDISGIDDVLAYEVITAKLEPSKPNGVRLAPEGVTGYYSMGDKITFEVNAETAGEYKLVLNYSLDDKYDCSIIDVSANDKKTTAVLTKTGDFYKYVEKSVATVTLNEGTNIITLTGASKGYICNLKYIKIVK